MSLIGGLSLARLLHHLDKHFSGLRRIRNFSQEGDASSMHSILGFQAHAEFVARHAKCSVEIVRTSVGG